MSRTIHCCLNIEGFMSHSKFPRDYRHMFTNDDGSPMTPEAVRAELFACLRRGWRVIPVGKCNNFDYQKGCLGHEDPEAKPR